MDKNVASDLEGPFYHLTPARNREAILNEGIKARSGSWHGVTWDQRVFFVTNRMAAYEMAQEFMHERPEEFVLILVEPTKMTSSLVDDRDRDQGVWTGLDVPAAAIIGTEEIDESVFESDEFLDYMGFE